MKRARAVAIVIAVVTMLVAVLREIGGEGHLVRAPATSLPRHTPILVSALYSLPPVLVRRSPSTAADRDGSRPPTGRGTATRVERALTGVETPVRITAYCLRAATRTGRAARPGIVAADPRVFPLGAEVDVFVGARYLGRFLVDDTGGSIIGATLDVWMASCDDAIRFGVRRGAAILHRRH